MHGFRTDVTRLRQLHPHDHRPHLTSHQEEILVFYTNDHRRIMCVPQHLNERLC